MLKLAAAPFFNLRVGNDALFLYPNFVCGGYSRRVMHRQKKEPDMGKRNTNSWEGQRPRCPQLQPETAQTPKSSYSQKQHNTAIGLLLSRCAHEISSCRFSAGCSHGRAYEGFRAPSCRPSTTERCGLPPSPRWQNVSRILGTSLSGVRMRRAFGLE